MISVIIPYHNNIKTIKRAVLSALGQSYKNLEIIIIDNGSDEPLSIDDLPEDKRIRLYVSDDIKGVAAARNAGIEMAKGEYIAFLDADDFWHPMKLEKQLKAMETYRYMGKAPVLCFTGRRMIHKKKRGYKKGKWIPAERIVDYRKLLRTNQINCSSVLIPKRVLSGYAFPEGNLHEDYALWLSILKNGGYALGLKRPYLYYSVSKKSKSGAKIKSALMTYRVYRREGINLPECIYHMMTYTVAGFKKHGIIPWFK